MDKESSTRGLAEDKELGTEIEVLAVPGIIKLNFLSALVADDWPVLFWITFSEDTLFSLIWLLWGTSPFISVLVLYLEA